MAEETAQAIAESVAEWQGGLNLATREDIQTLDTKIQSLDTRLQSLDTKVQALDTKVQALDTRLQALEIKVQSLDSRVQSMDTRVQALDTKIAEAKADILKWMFGAIGFQTFVILGALLALAHTSGPR